MSTQDIRSLMDTIALIESERVDEINWRQGAASLAAMAALAGPAHSTEPISTPVTSNQMAGSFYPVFFDKYSVEKIDSLADKINSGKVKEVIITYDTNEELANKIAKNLSVITGEHIKSQHKPQQDTKDTQYDHNRVTAIVNPK